MTPTTPTPSAQSLRLEAEYEAYMAQRPAGAPWGSVHSKGLGLDCDWGITDGYQTWKV